MFQNQLTAFVYRRERRAARRRGASRLLYFWYIACSTFEAASMRSRRLLLQIRFQEVLLIKKRH